MSEQLSAPLDDFKPREIEIINLMAAGHSNREIADQLYITKETVRWYNKQIYQKLGTSRRTEAIALARSFGLLDNNTDTADDPKTETPPTRYTLPATTGPFVGRDTILEELAALMGREDVRLLSLVATGGMGKSRLSLELGARLASSYERGAAFVDLTPIRQSANIARAALAALNVQPDAKADPNDLLFNVCSDKHLLLIFDNMEHVLDGAGLLADLLAAAPNVKLIATSRERLNLRVETVYEVPAVTEYAADLFIAVAALMRPEIVLDDDERAAVGRVVAAVGGSPLALTLAATWIDTLTVEEIADEIENSLDFLNVELADIPERQRSIRAVIDPTWAQLSPAEQTAFAYAGVFRGGFTRKLFQAVTGGSLRVLQTLLARSLVTGDRRRRYDLQPLLRQYAREKLTANLDSAKGALLAALLDFVTEQNKRMANDTYVAALDAIAAEQDNVRAALEWALLDGKAPDDGTQLALAMYDFWNIRSHATEAETVYSAALRHDLLDEHRAHLLVQRARMNYRLNNLESIKRDAKAGLALGEALNNDMVIAHSLLNLEYTTAKANHEERLALFQRAQAHAERSNDPQLLARFHNSASIFHAEKDDYQQALHHLDQTQHYCEAIGDLMGLSRILYNRAITLEQMGQRQEKRHLLQKSLDLKRQIGDRAGLARRLSVLAFHEITDEKFEAAASNLRESLRLCEDVGDRSRWAYTMAVSALLDYIQGDFDTALAKTSKALPSAEHLATYTTGNLLELQVSIYAHRGQVDAARQTAHRHLAHAQQYPRRYYMWTSLLSYARVLWATGDSAALPVTATLYNERALGSGVDSQYLFNPHIYRVKQGVGEAAWEAAVANAAPLETVFAAVIANLDNP